MAQARKGMRPGARTRPPGHLEPFQLALKLTIDSLVDWEKPNKHPKSIQITYPLVN
jgi:hypothetical protein